MAFRDTELDHQTGKNAFLSVNHTAGRGTSTQNQDRAMWIGMTNDPTSNDASMQSMACLQMQLDINGAPAIGQAVDGEYSTLSIQLSDLHTGAIDPPAFGANCMRATNFREVGSGSWNSTGPSVLELQYLNYSSVNGQGMTCYGIRVGCEDGNADSSNLSSCGVYIQSPQYRFANNNVGLLIGNFGNDERDIAFEITGGQSQLNSAVGVKALFPWGGGNGQILLGGSLGTYGFAATRVSAIHVPQILNEGTPGGTTYSYVYVARDINGNGVASATGTTTTGNATLDTTNWNYLDTNGRFPLETATVDVYRTVGPASTGKIGTFPTNPINSTQFESQFFRDQGQVGDGTVPPTGNATGSIVAGGPISAGQYTVATLPMGVEGQTAYATNGRKSGEGGGAGTGVPVYFSNAAWRVYSTDVAVTA
jgi:hypothetical protein